MVLEFRSEGQLTLPSKEVSEPRAFVLLILPLLVAEKPLDDVVLDKDV